MNHAAGSLTIQDSVGTGSIVCTGANGSLINVTAGQFVLESGTLDVSGGNAVAVSVGGNTTSSSAVIADGSIIAAEGNTAIVSSSFCTIEGGNIDGKVDSAESGAITITGGTFTDTESVNEILADSGYMLDESGNLTIDEEHNDFAAKIGNKGYATLQDAIDACPENGTVVMLRDVEESQVLEVKKSITIEGGNYEVNSTATRILWVDASDVTVTLNNIEFVSQNAERGVQVNPNLTGVTLNINNCVIPGTYYAVNICSNTSVTLSIDQSTISGWGALNLWGQTYEVTVTNSTLNGHNDKGYSAAGWNGFGVVVLEGDTTGQTDEHVEGCHVVLENCTINASTKVNEDGTANIQKAILFNAKSKNNLVEIKGDTTVVTYDQGELTPMCVINGESNNLVIYSGTFSSDVSAYVVEGRQANADNGVWTIGPATGEDYVATVDGTSYKTLQAAINAAGEGDTVTLMRPVTENVLISGKKAITLDGKGIAITGAEGNQEYGIQVYCSDNVILKDVAVTGAGKSGLLVNASSVVVEGNLDLSGNGGNTFWATALNVSYGQNINGSHPTSLTFAEGATLTGVDTVYSDKDDVARAKEAGTTITIGAVPGLAEVKGLENTPNCWTSKEKAEAAAVAESDGTYYITLPTALTDTQTGSIITLLKDIPNSGRVMLTKSITIDLNGHTISGGDQFATIMLNSRTANVEIKNGTISDTNAARGAVYVQQGAVTLTNVTVNASVRGVGIGPGVKGYYGKATLNAGTTITATESGVGIFGPNDGVTPKCELIINEGVSITSQLYGIAGNGSNDDTIITINGGTVTATGGYSAVPDYSAGIYHPQQGTLTVNGGTITGKVGIQMAGGTAVINGGSIVSDDTEVRADPFKAAQQGDGMVLDGAALSLVSRLAYGDIDVTVTGGTFTCASGNQAVRKYGMQKTGQAWEVIPEPTTSVLKISDGTFSTPVEFAHCAENYLPVTKGEAYGVAEGPLTLSAEYLPLVVGGESGTLTVVKPENVIGLTWEFDRNVIGFNPETGVVTASGRGEATITAKVGDQTATCTVVVTQPVESVTLDQDTASMMVGGETVTLTATINPVYANEQTIVWASSNTAIATVTQNGVITAVGGGTAVITATVGGKSAECTVTVTVPVIPGGGPTTITDQDVPLASVLPFDDVTEGQWFYDAVAYAYENNLMAGITDNLFDPQGNTTRGMIVTILYRLEGEPAVTGTSAFDDVADGQWYTNAVIWGTDNKVVAGYGDGTYRPTQNITREELAAILYRYASLKGYDVTVAEGAALNFPDADEVSEYARPAVLWCVEKGLINGMDNGTVSARSGATRAQAAAILKGFCENFTESK